MKKLILLTRPESDAQELAAQIKSMDFSAFIEPMLHIDLLRAEWPDSNDFDGFILTSAHALLNVPPSWIAAQKPVFAVGNSTAEKARAIGFKNVISASGAAIDLEALLRSQSWSSGARLLHPCGVDRAALFNLPGIDIVPLPVYRAEASIRFSESLLSLLDSRLLDAVLFFSPRTGRIFADLAARHGRIACLNATKALCLSAPVLQSIQHLPWQDVRQAAKPDTPSILALLRDSFSA